MKILVPLLLVSLLFPLRAFGQVIPLRKGGLGGLDFSKPLPPTAFDTPQERELSAAMVRMLPQVAREKDKTRRFNAKRALAQGFARLGRQEIAWQLAPDDSTRLQVIQFSAKRQILAGKRANARARIEELPHKNRVELQLMMASSALNWRDDSSDAIRWARLALKNAKEISAASRFESQERGDAFNRQLQAASLIGKAGQPQEAEKTFRELASQTKNDWLLSQIFLARWQSGLREPASAMLKSNDGIRYDATLALALEGEFEEALLLGENLETREKWNHLLFVFGYTGAAPTEFAKMHKLIENQWADLSSGTKEWQIRDYAKVLLKTGHTQLAVELLQRELKGEKLKTEMEILTSTASQYAYAALSSLDETARRKWGDAIFQAMRRSANQDDRYSKTQTPLDIAQLAVWLKRLDVARQELVRAETARAKFPTINPEEFDATRAYLWRELGEEKRALALENRLLKLPLENWEVIRLGIDTSNRQLGIKAMQTRPTTDPESANFAMPYLLDYPTRGVPQWILQIPDATARAVALAGLASHIWPLDHYYMMG